MAAPSILVLLAHPELRFSRINRALLDAALTLARTTGGPQITVRDLYALYPDHLIDVAAEQALAARAELIVWQHPIHWFGMPPLMKQWLDDVLTAGWAYGAGGTALRGKDLWLVASCGTHDAAPAFLPPYEHTAAVCGLRFVAPLILRSAELPTAQTLQAQADQYRQRLQNYPSWAAG